MILLFPLLALVHEKVSLNAATMVVRSPLKPI